MVYLDPLLNRFCTHVVTSSYHSKFAEESSDAPQQKRSWQTDGHNPISGETLVQGAALPHIGAIRTMGFGAKSTYFHKKKALFSPPGPP
jgi:hypothetical protein